MKIKYIFSFSFLALLFIFSNSVSAETNPCLQDINKFCKQETEPSKINDCLSKSRLKLSDACKKQLDTNPKAATAKEPDCESPEKSAPRKEEKPIDTKENCDPGLEFEEIKAEN